MGQAKASGRFPQRRYLVSISIKSGGIAKTSQHIRKQADINLITQLQAENLNLTEKLRSTEDKAYCGEQAVIQAEDEIKSQRHTIQELQMTVHVQQQDLLNWMALCEWYEVRSLQCSDVLCQLMAFMQGDSSTLSCFYE